MAVLRTVSLTVCVKWNMKSRVYDQSVCVCVWPMESESCEELLRGSFTVLSSYGRRTISAQLCLCASNQVVMGQHACTVKKKKKKTLADLSGISPLALNMLATRTESRSTGICGVSPHWLFCQRHFKEGLAPCVSPLEWERLRQLPLGLSVKALQALSGLSLWDLEEFLHFVMFSDIVFDVFRGALQRPCPI